MSTKKAAVAIVSAIALVASLFTVVQAPSAAIAANPAQFEPGHIIDDGIFFDGTAMNAEQVQSFVALKEANCAGTCLRNYVQTTPSIAAAPGKCAAYTGQTESAAQIITNVGAACGISQKALLVLLEKEQGLVTALNPSAAKIAKATGYSCPDTAACDPAYSGFFYQVYYAARQFKNYAVNPTSFNHQAGRVNNIRVHPNAACGTIAVYIQNKATAGLYNYTPYTPNAAAMGNLYGTGDGCSSYGNRNFWRYYSDWFGSPVVGSSIVRTTTDSSVYLTSGSFKYPITSMPVLNALFPLGQVAYVSQAFLDSYTTSHPVGRVIRGEDGSIYFFDSGIKLPFTSCDLVIDYGGSCTADGYVQLNDAQISAFWTGPAMGSVMGTAEGGRYAVNDGVKREILDERSQVEAGLSTQMNVLSENALAGLPLGVPVVRDSAYILQRGSSSYFFASGGKRYAVSGPAQSLGIPTRTTGSLLAASINQLPDSGLPFTGSVTTPTNPGAQLITDAGVYRWAAGAGGYNPAGAVPMSDELFNSYPVAGTIGVSSLIKTASSASVYIVLANEVKPIGSWPALLSLSVGSTIVTVSDRVIASVPLGTVALTAGSLVRSPGNPSIYVINGITNRIPVTSFDMTNEAGITGWEMFTDGLIQAYPQSEQLLGFGYTCDTTSYVAAGGSIHPIAPANVALWPIQYIALDKFTCAQMKIGAAAPNFIRTSDGSIYLLSGGKKLPISSMSRFAALGGTTWLSVHPRLSALIPTGGLA